jgi:uncharacterized protein with GYD domain
VATFIMLTRLTDEGARTIRARPEHVKEVNREIEGMGARVVSQWAVLGPYDFVNVVEAPDTMSVIRISSELSSRGTVRIQTLAALPIDEFISGLQPLER